MSSPPQFFCWFRKKLVMSDDDDHQKTHQQESPLCFMMFLDLVKRFGGDFVGEAFVE